MQRRPALYLHVPILMLLLNACGDKAQTASADANTDANTGEVSADTAAPDSTESDTGASADTGTSADTGATADTPSSDTADAAADSTEDGAGEQDTSTPPDSSTPDTSGPVTCSADEDCSYCLFDSIPTNVADCVCPFCPTYPMPKSQCAANTEAWNAVCGGENWLNSANCPQPRCVNNPPVECNAGVCEAGCDPTVGCPALLCPESEQETLPGECCPRCKEKTGCTDDGECVTCAYSKLVTAPEECECILCPVAPMTASECAANTASWMTHCEPWPLEYPCPVAMCLPQAAPVCEMASSQCVENPNGCFGNDDCGACLFPVAPQVPSDCRCPTCAVPLNADTCQANIAAVDTVCADFDFEACLPVPCPRPPDIVCTESFTCGYDLQVR